MKIVFTGGGTGGHIFPITAVARQLDYASEQNNRYLKMIFIGPVNGNRQFLELNKITTHNIAAGKLRRYFSFKNFTDLFRIFIGFIQSYVYLWWHMPDVIFSKGGYGSFTTVFIGWLFRIPVILHESDSVPGAANKLMARFAQKIMVSFPVQYPELPQHKLINIGNPVRQLVGGDRQTAKQQLAIQSQKPVIFIAGGSQGALQINSLVLSVLKSLTDRYEVIHQTGQNHYQRVFNRAKSVLPQENLSSYHPAPFFEESRLKHIFAVSNLIVSRAGAGAIFEIASVSKPSILIPLAGAAGDHQEQNAFVYANTGAAVSLTPQNVSGNILLRQIDQLLADQNKLNAMSEAAGKFARPDSARQIAQFLLNYHKGKDNEYIITANYTQDVDDKQK